MYPLYVDQLFKICRPICLQDSRCLIINAGPVACCGGGQRP
ncbi:hypothetical protein TNCT_487991, partial [Trichonephila clavata]